MGKERWRMGTTAAIPAIPAISAMEETTSTCATSTYASICTTSDSYRREITTSSSCCPGRSVGARGARAYLSRPMAE